MPNKNKRNNKKSKANSNRAIVRVDGQGNYWTEKIAPFFKKVVPDGTFSQFGGRVGTELGRMAPPGYGGPASDFGNRAGTDLGSRFARLVGFGDYRVESNSLTKEGVAIRPGEAIPSFGVLGHATRVRHREFIGDIVVPATPSAFTNTTYKINPGDVSTFPWLASIAANYQQYRFEGLVFEFKTLSSDITTGGALGAVIMATNYDVLENPYPDKVRMENSQYAVSAKPSCSQVHTIECDPKASANKLWYVRDATSVSGSSDDRFFDLGKFQIATSGLPGSAGDVLGELWASYDVSLFKPEIASVAGPSSKIVGGGTISDTAIFGTAAVITGTDIATAAGSTLTFTRSGSYLVVLTMVGTGANVCTESGTATLEDDLWTELAAATTSGTFVYRVEAAEGQTLVLDASAWTTVTASTTRITDYVYTLD